MPVKKKRRRKSGKTKTTKFYKSFKLISILGFIIFVSVLIYINRTQIMSLDIKTPIYNVEGQIIKQKKDIVDFFNGNLAKIQNFKFIKKSNDTPKDKDSYSGKVNSNAYNKISNSNKKDSNKNKSYSNKENINKEISKPDNEISDLNKDFRDSNKENADSNKDIIYSNKEISDSNKEISNSVKENSDYSYQSSLSDVKYLYQPDIPQDLPSQIINYEGYTVSFNRDTKIANWVGYELTREETDSKVKRVNKFIKDDNAINCPVNSDYAKSGYDRGHMAPAGDMSWSENVMKESFYFTNMTPQEPSFNRGIWKKLEDKCREWAIRDSAIIIITGPVIKGEEKRIGKNQVTVPGYLFKIILSPFKDNPEAVGFLIKNEGSLSSLSEFMVSVDSIETITGYDFFHLLPQEYQNKIESNFEKKFWFN